MSSSRESEIPLSAPLAEAVQTMSDLPLDSAAIERVRLQARRLSESAPSAARRQSAVAGGRAWTRSWRIGLVVATLLIVLGLVLQSSSRLVVSQANRLPSVERRQEIPATRLVPRIEQAPTIPVVTITPAKTDGPRNPQQRVLEPSFSKDPLTGALRVSYDSLDLFKVLKVEEVTPDAVTKMPPWQRGLDGQQIVIRGYMRPQFTETGLDQFLLVPNTGLCRFGPNPKIYEQIEVTMAKGLKTDYIELRPFDVVGTLRIKLAFEDNFAQGLYYLEQARIVLN